MTGYSERQMRREYRAVLRFPAVCAVLTLLAAAVFGAWGVASGDGGKWHEALMVCGVALCLCLACLGAYLLLSDKKWLLRHTLFGRALQAFDGGAAKLAPQLDDEARRRMRYEGNHFDLTENWLILYQRRPIRLDPRRVCAYPIPKEDVQGVSLRQNQGREKALTLRTRRGQFSFSVWDQKEYVAILAWIGTQEIKLDE